jgi:hypothetical protein
MLTAVTVRGKGRGRVTRESMSKPPEPVNQVAGSMIDVRIREEITLITASAGC